MYTILPVSFCSEVARENTTQLFVFVIFFVHLKTRQFFQKQRKKYIFNVETTLTFQQFV